jgi:hypothetical protein
MTTPAPEQAAQLPEWLWLEDVATLAGVAPRSITWMASNTRRKLRNPRKYGKRSPGDLPLPRRPKVQRTVDGVTMSSPQWARADILAWLPQRRGPGGVPGTHPSLQGDDTDA